jgi:repressor LexA
MPLPPLTKRQREIVDFFQTYVRAHSISPTLEEIAQAMGVNKVTIFGHVAELERKGVLRKTARGISRALKLAPSMSAIARAPRRASLQVLGTIAAGKPIEAIESPEELDLADLVPRDRDVYALRVRGDSMIDDSIRDGDMVLVERRQDPRNGEIVVAVLPGEEATLKRFYREGDRIRLQPANAALTPMYVPDVEVRGIVLGVIRRY